MKKILTLIFTVAITIAVVVAIQYSSKNITDVYYVRPQKIKNQTSFFTNGRIISDNMAEVYTDTPIYVDEIYFKVGDKVKKDDVLAKVDTEKTINILTSSTQLEKSINTINEFMSKLPNPELLYTFAESFNISKKEIDDLFYSAKYNTQTKKNSYVYSEIISPIDGIITEINLMNKSLFNNNSKAFKIVDNENLKAAININQNDIEKINENTEIIIFDKNNETKGKIINISPEAENINGNSVIKVIVELENSEKFSNGFNIEAKIYENKSEEILTLPIEAINQDMDNNEFVYVFNNNALEKKNICVEAETFECSSILSGISIDDIIIVSQSEIDEKTKINIKGDFYDNN